MSHLFHFLTDLALAPKKQEMFASNPRAVMEAAGLSDSNQIRLNSGDREEISAAVADELQTDEFVVVMGDCCLGDPGPDPSPDPDPPSDSEPDEDES